MNEKHRVFLLPKGAAIGRVLFTLCQSEGEPCYPTKIHRTMTDPSYAAVYDAIHQFKDHGWITQAANAGRKTTDHPDRRRHRGLHRTRRLHGGARHR